MLIQMFIWFCVKQLKADIFHLILAFHLFSYFCHLQDAKDQETDTKKEENEETVDIDLNDPETEKAALKIQAGFKGFQTRKEIKAKMEGQNTETKEEVNEESTAEKTEEVDIDLNDPEVEKAATKIQAGFKGFKTRQDMKAKAESGTDTKAGDETEQSADKTEETTEEKSEEKTEETQEAEKTEGEEVDIDLDDPDVAKAAIKIQAGFKGFKTRQEIKQKTSEETKDDGEQIRYTDRCYLYKFKAEIEFNYNYIK